ncbi:MAG: hypothetical protein OQL08_07245 [Gammaproteobacteria bacterium]|nr:hypothetical protein [Gammaproteobacteria bacterium]
MSTNKLQPGMVLGADVKDLSGRLLLNAGTEVQQQHLKVLRTWGVSGVEVVGEGGEEPAVGDSHTVAAALSPEALTAIEGEIEKRFVAVTLSHPVMVALVALVRDDLTMHYFDEALFK